MEFIWYKYTSIYLTAPSALIYAYGSNFDRALHDSCRGWRYIEGHHRAIKLHDTWELIGDDWSDIDRERSQTRVENEQTLNVPCKQWNHFRLGSIYINNRLPTLSLQRAGCQCNPPPSLAFDQSFQREPFLSIYGKFSHATQVLRTTIIYQTDKTRELM